MFDPTFLSRKRRDNRKGAVLPLFALMRGGLPLRASPWRSSGVSGLKRIESPSGLPALGTNSPVMIVNGIGSSYML